MVFAKKFKKSQEIKVLSYKNLQIWLKSFVNLAPVIWVHKSSFYLIFCSQFFD